MNRKREVFWISARIAIFYAVIGGLWIFFSDSLISLMLDSSTDITRFQTYKGMGFLLVTALLLFVYVFTELKIRRDVEDRYYRDLKDSNQALKNSEEKFFTVFQTVPQIQIISDKDDLRILDINNRITDFFDMGPETVSGQSIKDISCFHTLLELLEKTRTPKLDNMETSLERSDGTTLEVAVWTREIVIEGKKKLLWIIQDISREKKALEDAERALMGVITAMGRIFEKRDPYTHGHQMRVAELAVAIAEEMDLSETVIEGIRISGYIHDIGKIAIPSEILTKPAALSEVEYGLIKLHPETGKDFIEDIEFPWPVKKIIYQHHERMDGSGYPLGLSGYSISLEARIMAVADVVEAMSSHRPYRPGHGIEAALEEIERQAGNRLDEKVVEACLVLFREKDFTFSDN